MQERAGGLFAGVDCADAGAQGDVYAGQGRVDGDAEARDRAGAGGDAGYVEGGEGWVGGAGVLKAA